MYYSQCVDQKLVRQPVGSVKLAGGQKRGEGAVKEGQRNVGGTVILHISLLFRLLLRIYCLNGSTLKSHSPLSKSCGKKRSTRRKQRKNPKQTLA